jgi:tetratricopeptide (TPR) repeat protein
MVLFILTWLVCATFAQGIAGSEQALIARGVLLLRAGQASQAKVSFDAAVKAFPQSAAPLIWRGICENQLAQYAAAVVDFRSALRIDRSAVPAHYNLALSLIRLHEIDPAIDQLRTVIASQPNTVQPRYNLAILLEGRDLLPEAVRELDMAHALEPSDQDVTTHLLLDDLKIKDPSKVAILVKEIANPSAPLHLQLQAGAALIEAGRFAEAITILESCHARESDTHDSVVLLARAYLGDQKDAEAIALLTSVPVEQRDEESIYILAQAYTAAADLPKAVGAFEAAARADPKDARPLYHLGLLAAASSGAQDKSAELLRSAVKLAPTNTAYALAFARVLLVSDQAEEAKIVLSKVSASGGDSAELHALTGVGDAATHNFDAAISELLIALKEDPKLALAHNVLGFCQFQQGKYAEAAVAYGNASSLEPQRILYAHDAALAFQRANQMQQALVFAERANTLGDEDASNHILLGKLYGSLDRTQDAIKELQRAIELNPDLESAYYLLARTYMQMGNRQQATEWSEKLSRLKERREAALTLQKNSSSTIRSSALLRGGSLQSDEAGEP